MLEPITGSEKSLLFEKVSLQKMSSPRNKKISFVLHDSEFNTLETNSFFFDEYIVPQCIPPEKYIELTLMPGFHVRSETFGVQSVNFELS
ncbi:hypothetical protein WDU94_007952 [Cyamophila willieti]